VALLRSGGWSFLSEDEVHWTANGRWHSWEGTAGMSVTVEIGRGWSFLGDVDGAVARLGAGL
jgi:hypothetical protein